MQEQPFKLTKRFRHQEEYAYLNAEVPWTKAILNVEGGTVLGRTPFRWLLLITFYTFFFASIMLLWYFCYWIFDKTLTMETPRWSLQQPGFSFEPSITMEQNYLNIEYYEHLEDEIDLYVDRIYVALKKYGNVEENYFGPCHKDNEYGYKNRNPCFFLKINRIIGFNTETIENVNELPQEAASELKSYIQELTEANRKNRIWISCESKPGVEFKFYPHRFFNTSDVDIKYSINHDATVEYISEFGPENSRFYNKEDFKRLIAVQIKDIPTNVKHHIRCYLWAKNIQRDLKGRLGCGLVRFSIEVKS